MVYRAAGERLPWQGTQSLLKTGCRSGAYATLVGAGAGPVGELGGVGEFGGFGVVGAAPELVVPDVFDVVAALDGPSGTPFEQPTVRPIVISTAFPHESFISSITCGSGF